MIKYIFAKKKSMAEWFEDWFDSDYYHLLYSNRDYSEAQQFIRNLVNRMSFSKKDRILDLACGKGRHTIFLNEIGFNADGCDLSKNSIDFANKSSNSNINFFIHDIRNELQSKYDIILNLFTSFGYFDTLNDNLNVMQKLHSGIEKKGTLIIDFLNSTYVENNLIHNQIIKKGDIDFQISKSIENKKVIKTIQFSVQGKDYRFEEKVQLLSFEDFEFLANKSGFIIENTFGEYDLSPFNKEQSSRLILHLTKK